jgi:hypothetical protein
VATCERSLLGEVSLSSAASEILRMRIHMHHLQEMFLTGKTFKLIFPIPGIIFRFFRNEPNLFQARFARDFFYHPSKTTWYSCHRCISFLLSVLFGNNVLFEK